MSHCWHTDRDERPTFAHIVSELDTILHELMANECNDTPFEIYINSGAEQPEGYISPVSNADASYDHVDASGNSPGTPFTHEYFNLTTEAWQDQPIDLQ